MCQIPDTPSLNLGFGNNRKNKSVHPSWVNLWNRSRCPLMNDRWKSSDVQRNRNRYEYKNRYVHMRKREIKSLWHWQRSKTWWGVVQGLRLRWEPRPHPLPLPVLPEDTAKATLNDGAVETKKRSGGLLFFSMLTSDGYWPLEWLRNTCVFGYHWLSQ